jgi:hypothetical protein
MPLGWEDLQLIKRVEERANNMGFELSSGRYTYGYDAATAGTLIYLRPKDDAFPHYSRGADIFCGSIESIDTWLTGLTWAREYDELLKLSNVKKRSEKEQAEKNKQLLRTIKTGRKAEGIIGSSDLNEWRLQQEEEFDIDDEIPF